MSYKYVKFTGDYSKLKGMGYTFQKLFSGNFMTWEKNGLAIWKRGATVKSLDFDLYKLATLLKTNPPLKSRGVMLEVYKRKTSKSEYEYLNDHDGYEAYMTFLHSMGRGSNFPQVSIELIPIQSMDAILELNALGWFELAEMNT